MSDPRSTRPRRGPIAASFDAMTLTVFVVVTAVSACSVLEVGPAETWDRLGTVVSGAFAAVR